MHHPFSDAVVGCYIPLRVAVAALTSSEQEDGHLSALSVACSQRTDSMFGSKDEVFYGPPHGEIPLSLLALSASVNSSSVVGVT